MTAGGDRFLVENCDALSFEGDLCEELLRGGRSADVEISVLPGGRPRLRYRGEDVYDSQDPMGRIASELSELPLDPPPDAVVFFGFGIGVHAEIVRRRSRAPIVVFEPCTDILRAALSTRPLRLTDVRFVASAVRLVDVVDGLIDTRDRRVEVVVLPGYRRLFSSELERFWGALERAFVNVEIRDSTLKRAPDWISNMAVNLPNLAARRNAAALEGAFRGVPGIFVGAGPSLDDSIESLRAASGRALIIAANASLRPLLTNGIVPQLVANIEAADLRRHFDGLALGEIVLAACANTHPAHLEFPFADILHVAFASSPEADWYEAAFGFAPFSSGGSVACAMFAILHRLGCDPIIAVGMDLAFSDSKVHATGSDPAQKSVHLDKESNLIVPESDGEGAAVRYRAEKARALGGRGEVLTMDVLTSYRTWFEGAAVGWAKDRKLINATARGARIEGFEELELSMALARHGTIAADPGGRLAEAIAAVPAHDVAKVARALGEELEVLRDAASLARQSIDAVDRALAAMDRGALDDASSELGTLGEREESLRKASRRSRLLNMALITAAREIRRGRFEDADADVLQQTAKSLARSRLLFEKIARAAEDLSARFEGVAASVLRGSRAVQ